MYGRSKLSAANRPGLAEFRELRRDRERDLRRDRERGRLSCEAAGSAVPRTTPERGAAAGAAAVTAAGAGAGSREEAPASAAGASALLGCAPSPSPRDPAAPPPPTPADGPTARLGRSYAPTRQACRNESTPAFR